MRLGDLDAIEKFIEDGLNNPDKAKAFGHDAIEVLAEVHYAPTIDAVVVCRCRDCEHYKAYHKPVEDFDGRCTARGCETDELEFCSYGGRRCDNEM